MGDVLEMDREIDNKNIKNLAGITCDSRQVKPDYAFVAITGNNYDGNNFIDEAIANGASMIFTERDIEHDQNIPIIKVKDTRQTLGYLAASFYDNPSKKIKMIGVTGTNGKTTTTHLIYELLNYKSNSKKSGLIGTVKVDTGFEIEAGDLTTPPPVKLQRTLAKMVAKNLKYACMEVSSHGIKLKRISGSTFTIKVGTNISLDHFDLHPDITDYIQVKKGFLTDPTAKLVLINGDDPYLNSLGSFSPRQFNYGLQGNHDILASQIKQWQMGNQFVYQLNKTIIADNNRAIGPYQIAIKMKMPGRHNIYNALAAITIALYFGIKPKLIRDFFRSFSGVWRRLEQIHLGDYTIIDDCAHNPGSYEAVFQAVKEMAYQKLIIVNSLRGNRGVKINQKNADTISYWLKQFDDYLLCTSNCNDVVKPVDLVSKDEEDIFLKVLEKQKINFCHFQKLKPALKKSLQEVNKGDLILLLGPHAMDHASEIILSLINQQL